MQNYKSVPLYRIAYLIYLLIVDTDKFQEEEDADSRILNAISTTEEPKRVEIIRQGLIESLILCLISIAMGLLIGLFLLHGFEFGPKLGAYLLVSGAGVILWGTFGLGGWNIQSMDGSTLSERVNQWIFRLLYMLGTVLVTAGTIITI